MGATTNKESPTTESPPQNGQQPRPLGWWVRYIFTDQICTVVAAVVKTQILISSHGGFLACANFESSFNKSAEKC